MTAVRFRPVELVAQQRRIGELQRKLTASSEALAVAWADREKVQDELSAALSDNVALRRRQHELRGLVRKLAEHVRGRGIPALDAETLARIEEEGLAG